MLPAHRSLAQKWVRRQGAESLPALTVGVTTVSTTSTTYTPSTKSERARSAKSRLLDLDAVNRSLGLGGVPGKGRTRNLIHPCVVEGCDGEASLWLGNAHVLLDKCKTCEAREGKKYRAKDVLTVAQLSAAGPWTRRSSRRRSSPRLRRRRLHLSSRGKTMRTRTWKTMRTRTRSRRMAATWSPWTWTPTRRQRSGRRSKS